MFDTYWVADIMLVSFFAEGRWLSGILEIFTLIHMKESWELKSTHFRHWYPILRRILTILFVSQQLGMKHDELTK